MAFSIKKTGRLVPPDATRRLEKKLQETFLELVDQVTAADVARTRQGRDVKGYFFKGYVPSYRARRQAMGLPVSPVDLTVTGKLLDTIKNTVNFIAGRFTWIREIAADQLQKAEGLSKKRQFFGHSKQADEKIRKALKSIELEEILK